jgi:glycine/D-amino acid oxidase-like deaminating enzyme
VHPAKLAFGLLAACLSLGVRVFENTPALGIAHSGDEVIVSTREGRITARRVALATNGFPSLLKRNALLTVPIYDYVIVTEPLSEAELAEIGWTERFGMTDSSRQFHYYRKTADNRILWGGYDAVYHRGRRIRRDYDQRPETFERLADHFLTTFPTLRGIQFTHAWGGMIDMSTNFVPFQGLAMNGKVSYSSGYTGLGVAATRFGAAVMLDLLAGEVTPRTALKFSTTKPFPIPPEPIAYPAIQVMRNAIAQSDENGGKDGLLIKALEVFGIGFDS